MSIADVMTVKVVSVAPEDGVGHAIRRMAEENVGAIAVCRGDVIVGIFSERDVLRLAAAGQQLDGRPVSEVMTSRLVVAAPDDDIGAVAEMMRSRAIRHVPVVEDGRLLGVVSVRDVMAALVERLWRNHDEKAHETARALLQRNPRHQEP